MALQDTVTGSGKLIQYRSEGAASISYVQPSTSGGVNMHRITYTEERTTRKWYGLTESAISSYKAANPTKNVSGTCTNEIINSWEMTVESVDRTILSHSETPISEET